MRSPGQVQRRLRAKRDEIQMRKIIAYGAMSGVLPRARHRTSGSRCLVEEIARTTLSPLASAVRASSTASRILRALCRS